MKWTAAVIAVAAVASLPARAEDEWPRDTKFDGPLHFCAYAFAVDVAADEVATVRDPGLDFTITYLESGDRWLGLYQGNHPQTSDKKIKNTRFFRDLRVDRMTAADGATSYLVHALPDGSVPVLLHIFSNQFDGSEADKAVLQRFTFGDMAKTGCSEITYKRA
jgi:hypothetical protein